MSTPSVQRVLVIGGGFSGMSACIQMRKLGIDVELVEIDPGWRSYGAGISLGGATLRAFDTLGVLDEFLKRGSATDGVEIALPHGPVVATIPTPRIARLGVPGGGAIMRPVLADILAQATRESGTEVRLGCTFTEFEHDGNRQGVTVGFTDGQRKHYDLVIGADGIYSKVREALLPNAPKPKYSGQAVWRAVLPRPVDVTTTRMWVGPKIKVGVNPVSADEMYLFVTEDRETNDYVDPASFLPQLQALLAPFPAPTVQWCRGQLREDSQIVFRPLEGLLVPQPWHMGRVVLIGDTVHATTPHMASGACIGIEDAIVLAEELGVSQSPEHALSKFESRRWERCRLVVENSGRLGEIEIAGGDKDEHARIMRETMGALLQPI